jgi:hypothetical protein
MDIAAERAAFVYGRAAMRGLVAAADANDDDRERLQPRSGAEIASDVTCARRHLRDDLTLDDWYRLQIVQFASI